MHYVEEGNQSALFLLHCVNLILLLEIVHCAQNLLIYIHKTASRLDHVFSFVKGRQENLAG